MTMMKKALNELNSMPTPSFPLSEDFVIKTRTALPSLFPGINPEGKDDKRSFEKTFDLIMEPNIDNLPRVVWDLAGYGHHELKIPLTSYCIVTVGMYMRKSQMKIKAASKNTLCRVVLNYGYDEIYISQRIDPNQPKYREKVKETVVRSNTALLLGPGLLINTELFVSNNTNINLMPDNLPKGISPNMIRSMGGGNIDVGKTRALRGTNYQRFTVILDYRGNDELVNDLDKLVNASFSSNSGSNGSVLNNIFSNSDDKVDPKNKNDLSELVSRLLGNNMGKMPKSIQGLTQMLPELKKKMKEAASKQQNQKDDKQQNQKDQKTSSSDQAKSELKEELAPVINEPVLSQDDSQEVLNALSQLPSSSSSSSSRSVSIKSESIKIDNIDNANDPEDDDHEITEILTKMSIASKH